MKIETDIARIKALAREQEDENWEFRTFLKNYDLEVEEIDAIVHAIHEEVSLQIDCLACGNCCRKIQPVLDADDISRLAASLDMSFPDFTEKYLVADEDGEGHVFNSIPCPFLSGNSCTVYADRPEACRSYPHLHKPEFLFRMAQAISNCSVCPISYNVYERLKREIAAGDVGGFPD